MCIYKPPWLAKHNFYVDTFYGT
uniref:Uncharacterized protein n=1 Tax=Anguilla anguilla TaxID=7936 RepID=A0A0E9RK26_ANGAN